MNQPIIFYDATCGLCHGFVRFVFENDLSQRFLFAPRHGVTYLREVPAEVRDPLPESIVLWTPEKRALVESDVAIYTLRALGGSYAFLSKFIELFPAPIRNLGYRFVATIRKKIAGVRDCPYVDQSQAARFLP